MEAERAEREGNLQRVAEIRYGEIPELEQVLEDGRRTKTCWSRRRSTRTTSR